MTNEEKVIKRILKYQRDLDEYTLKLIATRLNSTKGLGLVDLFDIKYLNMVYGTMRDIEYKVEYTRKQQKKELEKILPSSAISAYYAMKGLYADGGIKQVPYKDNKEITDYVTQEVTSKVKEFDTILKGVGYPVISNKTNKIIFKSPSDTYQYIANEAKQQELTNPFGYDLWKRKITRGLLRDGLKIYNYNQDTHRYKKQNSYSYIRNFVKDAVYKLCQGVYNVVANQVGIDGVELSVHYDCALDHIPVQGHQFHIYEFKKMQSNEDFIDVEGRHYKALERAIGTWNCRHFVYPIIIGKTQQRYTDEQLEEIGKKSEYYKVIETSDGEKLSMSYSQYKNNLQRLQDMIDTLTLDMHVAEKLGDKWLVDYYKTRLSEYKSTLTSLKNVN